MEGGMTKEEYEQMAKDLKEARDAEPQVLRLKDGCKAVMLSPSSVETYKSVLQATQDVFGEENMTVDVMIEAIKVGGSIASLRD